MKRLLLASAALLFSEPAFAQTITPATGPVTGYQSSGTAVVTNAATNLTASQAQAVGGSTSIPFAVTSGITAGDILAGTSIPSGDAVVDKKGTTQVIRAANGAFLTGQPTIPFSSTTNLVVGMQCTDVTKPSAIGAGNLIASVAGGVSITLTSNTTAASNGAADSIQCDPTAVMQTTTSAAVAASAAINQYPGGTAYATPGQLNLLGGLWASGASGIAGLSFAQASGGGHNWGIGGAGNTYGASVTSYSLRSGGSDTSFTELDMYNGATRTFNIDAEAGPGSDTNIGSVNDNRFVLRANNSGVFEVAGGDSTGTGSFAGVVCCHAWSDRSYAGGSQTGAISPTTGSTVATLVDGTATYDFLYLTPAGTLATLTINLQATPADGQELTILSTQVVTALTFSAGGSLVLGAGLPSALAANVPVKIKCINTTSTASFKCLSSRTGTWVPAL